jgi:hypothetical protein
VESDTCLTFCGVSAFAYEVSGLCSQHSDLGSSCHNCLM